MSVTCFQMKMFSYYTIHIHNTGIDVYFWKLSTNKFCNEFYLVCKTATMLLTIIKEGSPNWQSNTLQQGSILGTTRTVIYS